MSKCEACGGRLRRIHRTLGQRFVYMALFECGQCKGMRVHARRYTFYFGDAPRCPLCGNFRVRRLAERDRIDPVRTGLVNWLQRMLRAGLYHCRFCRMQFYDMRKPHDSARRLAPSRGSVTLPAR